MVDVDSVSVSLVLVARLCLGVILLSAASGKLADLAGFTHGVVEYQLLPLSLAKRIALVLPYIELIFALALIAGTAVPLVALLTIALLIGFSLGVIVNLRRGREITCHCHGFVGTPTISWGTVVRNALLTVLAAMLVILVPHTVLFEQWVDRWLIDLTVLASPASALPLVLLIAFCLLTLQLVEWAMHIHTRTAQLSRKVQR